MTRREGRKEGNGTEQAEERRQWPKKIRKAKEEEKGKKGTIIIKKT